MRIRSFPLVASMVVLAQGACKRSSSQRVGGAVPDVASASSIAPGQSIESAKAPVAKAGQAVLPEGLSVLLLSIDSLRADMPWAGYPRPIAPYLTALEKRAVSYTQAYSLSSYTAMSVGGLLAGNYPSAIRRDGYFFGTYPKEVLMFPERLQEAGIRTMAVQAHGYFQKGTGLDQGFDIWKLVPNLKWNAQMDENITAPAHEAMAEEILANPQNTTGRFFAWFHFLDPHDQYKAHKDGTAWGSQARDLYDGEVEFTDKYVGKLIDFVEKQPWAQRTVLIVTADHGESFGEHGLVRHGFELYQSLIHVPWFFVIPGVAPHRIEVARSHIDLAPTILDFFHVNVDPPLPGISLVPELLGTADPEPRDIVVDLPRTSNSDRRRALIAGGYKVIMLGDDASYQVYDLQNDPEERHDLIKTDKEKARELIEKYKQASMQIHEVKPYVCRTLQGAPTGRDY